MSREKKGDARLVQVKGFDPEEVAMLNVETCLEKLGLKNGTPVIPRSSRDVEPNHHSLILRAVTENAVTTMTHAGNVCTWRAPREGGAFQWVRDPPGETLQPEATGAAMEVTKWMKPSDSCHDIR